MAEDQANSPQQTAPPQHSADNTEIMALLARMAEKMDTLIVQMDALILATQQSTPPAPQETKKEEANDEENEEIIAEKKEQEPRQQPRYQATVEDEEDDAESTEEKQTEHQYGSSKLSSDKPDSKTALSTIPRVCYSAACLTSALFSAYQHAMLLAWHGFLHGYMDYTEGMEASGQG